MSRSKIDQKCKEIQTINRKIWIVMKKGKEVKCVCIEDMKRCEKKGDKIMWYDIKKKNAKFKLK